MFGHLIRVVLAGWDDLHVEWLPDSTLLDSFAQCLLKHRRRASFRSIRPLPTYTCT